MKMVGKFSITLLTIVLSATAFAGNRSDWGASWIGAPWEGESVNPDTSEPAPVFKRKVFIGKGLENASVKICGLGLFELTINGIKVGDDVLVPNESLYSYRPGLEEDPILPVNGDNFRNYRIYYLEYDLKKYLHEGENEVRVLLGNGFFSSDSRRYIKSYGTPRMICRMDFSYSNGKNEYVVSDKSWKVAKSALLMNDLYDGEIYDARREGKEEWLKPVLRKAPLGKLEPQTAPADRVMEVLKPQSVKLLDNGDWEVDFGDYVTGWVRLINLHSVPRGKTIEVVYPTAEYGNGIQKYICRGGQIDESYTPRFTWFTFRTVRIRGMEKMLKPSQIRADVIYSNVRTVGRFECSDSTINRIQQLWWRTQTDNMHMGVPTDCPHRERGPYTGDGQVACIAAMHTFDMKVFYRKWIRDMSDCQDKVTGYVPNGAPWHPGCGGGVPWGAALGIVPWEHYLHYGDITVLEENYEAMGMQLSHMLLWRQEDGTMLQNFVDSKGNELPWLNLGEWSVPYSLPEKSLIHTYFLWKCCDNMSRVAKALGKSDDYKKYASLAEDVANSFHKRFYNPHTHSYGENNGSNIFALSMGVPDNIKDGVVESLKNEIIANGGHLNTGIFGTQLFFETLCDNGLEDLAYKAMINPEFPGYGYWVAKKADTLWEYWDGRNSRNHPMFGAALIWLYRRIAGVNTDEAEPGYKHIVIRPIMAGDLTWARYSLETQYGNLSVFWEKRSENSLALTVDIPAGTHATVYLPGREDAVEIGHGHYTL